MEKAMTLQAIPDLPGHDWDVVKTIEIHESGEALVDVPNEARLKQDPIYFRQHIAHAINQCFIRQSVLEKLRHAVMALPDNLGLMVLDAWRPRAVQSALREHIGDVIKQTYQNMDEASYQAILSKVVAPVAADFISPHLTGGSVGVTLYDLKTGDTLDMGSTFDEPTDASYTNAYESRPDHIAHQNRRILYHSMTAAGFTNITTEWWHYDYGNQLWAHYHKKKYAIYGEAKPQ